MVSRSGRPPRQPSVVELPTTPGPTAAFLLGIVSGLVLLVGELVGLPDWLVIAALAGLGIGALVSAVLAFRRARRQGRSLFRVVGRTVGAPIRFLFDWMP